MSKLDLARSSSSSISAASDDLPLERLTALLRPVVAERRLYLEKISIKAAGTHRTLQVVVDLPEAETGSVSLDVIAELSRALSAVLDASPEGDDRPYELEVSSPGVDRPLTELRHWRRSLGRIVKVIPVKQEHAGPVTGRLIEVTEQGMTLQPEIQVKKGMKPKLGESVSFEFDKVQRARVEVEFHQVGAVSEVRQGSDKSDESTEGQG